MNLRSGNSRSGDPEGDDEHHEDRLGDQVEGRGPVAVFLDGPAPRGSGSLAPPGSHIVETLPEHTTTIGVFAPCLECSGSRLVPPGPVTETAPVSADYSCSLAGSVPPHRTARTRPLAPDRGPTRTPRTFSVSVPRRSRELRGRSVVPVSRPASSQPGGAGSTPFRRRCRRPGVEGRWCRGLRGARCQGSPRCRRRSGSR